MTNNQLQSILKISTKSIIFKPDQKFFLVRFSQLYPHKECRLAVKDLAAEMGVNDRVVSSSVKFWENEGVLIKREAWEKIRVRKRSVGYLSISWGKVGELLSRQKLAQGVGGLDQTPHFLGHIESITPNAKRVQAVASKKNNSALLRLVKRHDLNVSQRLFLIMLLWMANACGVVRGVGKKRLCQLTGASRERLDAQIEALLRKGYLLAYMPGGSGRGIEGVYTATYFLNVNHESFSAELAVIVKSSQKFNFPVPNGRNLIVGVYNDEFRDGGAVGKAKQCLKSPLDKTLRGLISPLGRRYSAPIDTVMGGWFAAFWNAIDKTSLKMCDVAIDDSLHEMVRKAGEKSSAFRLDESKVKDQILEEVVDCICSYIWAVAHDLLLFIGRQKLGRELEKVDYIPAGCKMFVRDQDRITSSPHSALLVVLMADSVD